MRRGEVYPLTLLVAFIVIWGLLAIDPLSRSDWVLENLLVWLTLPLLVIFHRRLGFSRTSYALVFVFYLLHAIGGKWSYSNVPFPWESLGFERNHYDRVVHTCWGLLLFLPAREFVARSTLLGKGAASMFAACILTAGSSLYEVIEWGAVQVVAPDLGNEFLGAQGDEFDAPKDMGLATLGTILAWGITLIAGALSARNRIGSRTPSARIPVRPGLALKAKAIAAKPGSPTNANPAPRPKPVDDDL